MRKFSLILIVLLICAAAGVFVAHVQNRYSDHLAPEKRMRARMELSGQGLTFSKGGGPQITVKITNEGTDSFSFRAPMLGYGLRYEVKDANGATVFPLGPNISLGMLVKPPVVLQPGRSWTTDYNLETGGLGYQFTQPGRYDMHVLCEVELSMIQDHMTSRGKTGAEPERIAKAADFMLNVNADARN